MAHPCISAALIEYADTRCYLIPHRHRLQGNISNAFRNPAHCITSSCLGPMYDIWWIFLVQEIDTVTYDSFAYRRDCFTLPVSPLCVSLYTTCSSILDISLTRCSDLCTIECLIPSLRPLKNHTPSKSSNLLYYIHVVAATSYSILCIPSARPLVLGILFD